MLPYTRSLIELSSIDISTIGLRDLRSKIAIIPQDVWNFTTVAFHTLLIYCPAQPLLFSGTVRSNLDPFNAYDDTRLWDALRRSYLVENTAAKEANHSLDLSSGSTTPTSRFNLDTVIESDGANLSVGERSLLSLARALVKDSKVVGKYTATLLV